MDPRLREALLAKFNKFDEPNAYGPEPESEPWPEEYAPFGSEEDQSREPALLENKSAIPPQQEQLLTQADPQKAALDKELAGLEFQRDKNNRTKMIAGMGGGVDRIVSGLSGIKPNSKYYSDMSASADKTDQVDSAKSLAVKKYLMAKRQGTQDDLKRQDLDMRRDERNTQNDINNSFREESIRNSKERGQDRNRRHQESLDYKKEEDTDKDVQLLTKRLQDENLVGLDKIFTEISSLLPEKGENIEGFGAGAITPGLWLGEKGLKLRTAANQLRNILLKERSGGAVTDDESKRLADELGNSFGKSDTQFMVGYNAAKEHLQSIRDNVVSGFDQEARTERRHRGGDDLSKPFGKGAKRNPDDKKPRTVIQNGNRYTLNPETGQYE